MLRAGHVPVASRGPRLGGPSAERYGVNATAAAARSSLALPSLLQLGFRGHPLRRGSLSAAAPPPAFRARRGSFPCAPFRACSSGERVAEASPAGAPIVVWVKQAALVDSRYASVKQVDLRQTVDDFIARWLAQEQLDVRPSLVTLRLVPCGARKPQPEEEQAAAELDPRDTLADAGFTDGCSLLAMVAASEPKLDVAALESWLKQEVKQTTKQEVQETVKQEVQQTVKQEVQQTLKEELKYVGEQSLSSRTLAQMYCAQVSGQVLQLVKLPTWFEPDPVAPSNLWTPLPANTLEDMVQKQFESDVRSLAAASRAPTLVLLGGSTTPSIGTRKPDMVGYAAAAPAAAGDDAVPVSRFVTHIACIGSLKHRRAKENGGKFTEREKGGALNFADELMRRQQWRAHGGSLARVVAFLSDGEYIVFFECTFRVEVHRRALRVDPTSVLESAPLLLNGLGGAYLAGLTQAPLDALGYCLPQVEVGGAPVALRAHLGMGATSHGFAATWRGDDVVLKRYHAAVDAAAVEPAELDALEAARGVRGVCQLRGAAAGCLLLAPRGAMAYSLHARRPASPRAPAPAGLWSVAAPPAPPAVAADPVRPGASEFCDLVDALAGLHAIGWVHRDPRPANFFRDAAGRFFLADLGSAARVGDAAAAADGRPWAPQYGPLVVLRAAAAGAPPPAPAPAHDFEQVARLVFACTGDANALPVDDDPATVNAWWQQRDGLLLLKVLLPAAAAAAQGEAARRAFQDVIRQVLL